MLNNKHNSKSGKRKIRKRDFKEKQDRKPKKENTFIENKEIAILYFHVVLFMKQKQRKRTMKKETKTRNKKKAQEERQEGRKENKRKRETEKKKQKRGRPKKG